MTRVAQGTQGTPGTPGTKGVGTGGDVSPPIFETGAFVASEDTVGLEKLSWSLKVKGEHGVLSRSLGKYTMGNAQINVVEKGKSTDGVPYVETYSMYGPITAIKKEAVKMGEKPTITIEGTCKAYTQYDTGLLVHDINVNTGKTIIGGVDLMGLAGII